VWRRDGYEIGVSVNVSARQLEDDELIDGVKDALDGSGLDPWALTLEVTETTLMRDAEAAAAPCTRSSAWACGSRSTTSARPTARWRTCASSRPTRWT
jgi:EAL domain-containing protein (putative c-di-GMP-specific phosphodiesterase class I)